MGEVRVAGEERLACYTKRREEAVKEQGTGCSGGGGGSGFGASVCG